MMNSFLECICCWLRNPHNCTWENVGEYFQMLFPPHKNIEIFSSHSVALQMAVYFKCGQLRISPLPPVARYDSVGYLSIILAQLSKLFAQKPKYSLRFSITGLTSNVHKSVLTKSCCFFFCLHCDHWFNYSDSMQIIITAVYIVFNTCAATGLSIALASYTMEMLFHYGQLYNQKSRMGLSNVKEGDI